MRFLKETKETLLNMDHDEKTLTKHTKTDSHRPRKKKIIIKTTCSRWAYERQKEEREREKMKIDFDLKMKALELKYQKKD